MPDSDQVKLVPWRITKATTLPDGVMVWQATTTKFARDVQRDYVTRQFYEEAIKRFKSKAVPPPFFSVAHYPAEKSCVCGYAYPSYDMYLCPQCGKERLLAGVTTDIWIDGSQPKARGILYPTALGKSVFDACVTDLKGDAPQDERVRISMGFYPDPTGVITKSEGRDFMSGWIEHFAGTRVPVIPETDMTAELMQKSLNIKTKFDDAAAIVPKALADELVTLEQRRRIGKSETDGDEIVIKSQKVPEEVARVEVLPEQLKVQAEMASNTLKVVKRKGEQEAETKKRKEDEDEDAKSYLTHERADLDDQYVKTREKSFLSASEIDGAIYEDAASTLEVVQKAILQPGTDKQEVLARAANLIQSISDFASAARQTPDAAFGAEAGKQPTVLPGSSANVTSPLPNQSKPDSAPSALTGNDAVSNQQPWGAQTQNVTDESGLANAIAQTATSSNGPKIDAIANQISQLTDEEKIALSQKISGEPQQPTGVSSEDEDLLQKPGGGGPYFDKEDRNAVGDIQGTTGTPEDKEKTPDEEGAPENDDVNAFMDMKEPEEEPGEEDQTGDETTDQADEGEPNEEPSSDEDQTPGEEEPPDDGAGDEGTGDEESADQEADQEAAPEEADKEKEAEAPTDEETPAEKPAKDEAAPAKKKPAEEEVPEEITPDEEKEPGKGEKPPSGKKKLTFGKPGAAAKSRAALNYLNVIKKSLPTPDDSLRVEKSLDFLEELSSTLMQTRKEPVTVKVINSEPVRKVEKTLPMYDENSSLLPSKARITTEKAPIASATKGNSLEDKLPNGWTSMGVKFMSGEGYLGRVSVIEMDGPIPNGRFIVTRYRGETEELAHPKPLIAMDINEAIMYANAWTAGEEVTRRAVEPDNNVPVSHAEIAFQYKDFDPTNVTVVGVKSRTEPDAAVKSAATHPVTAFMDKWSQQVSEVVATDDGTLTRLQKRELVQKSLEEFGQQITGLIDNYTPIAQQDIDTVVKAAVEDAVNRVQVQNAQQMASLEAQMKSLLAQTVKGAVNERIQKSGTPQRRSLSTLRPPAGSEAVVKSAVPVLSGDTTENPKFSASEVAKMSIGTGVPRY